MPIHGAEYISKGERHLKTARKTTGLNPFGLGILYSVEMVLRPYKQERMHMVYAGITGQINPNDRFSEHYSGANDIYKNLKEDFNHQFSKPKLMYLTLGSAFYINELMTDRSQFKQQIINIINVVSLFDLAAMETKYIKDNKLVQPNHSSINNTKKLFTKEGLSKNGGVYGMNEGGGGEGALEKQAKRLDRLEWLFAAYYYIIEDDEYIKNSREKDLYNDKDSFATKIFKVVNQYRGQEGFKIPRITEEQIDNFVKSLGINETDKRLKGKVDAETASDFLVDPAIIFADNPLILEIEKYSLTNEDKVKMSERDVRNAYQQNLRASMSTSAKFNVKDIESLKIQIRDNKGKIPQAKLDKVTKTAISKVTQKLQSLISNSGFYDMVMENGASYGIDRITEILKEDFPDFQPTGRFLIGVSQRVYQKPKVIKLLFENILKIVIEEVKKGLEDYTGENLGEVLSKSIFEDLKKVLGVTSEKATLKFTKDLKETDIARIVGKNMKDNPQVGSKSKLTTKRGNV